ncbi:Lrp/AsnC family transcriptional regulator [Robertkochia aurantiaca]|uniref:Lrp/AsnC family transcriptional regulator n=1 Tax=Robertkochia aurantiaca TaxID=2873700 RepID=UPI001CCDD7A8|nr:Lrp/AsnC family transcriptional regulator [Robertkochia sp. 3YJGBD-33]
MKLDDTDKQLLTLLQKDAKSTTKKLAHQLKLSNTAVYERIRKLERNGVIEGYTAQVDREKIGRSFVAFCHVKLIQHSKEYVQTFEKEVVRLPEVQECYHTSGDYDYLLKIFVENMEAYRNFMITKLTGLKYIGSTHSVFMIGEVKNSSVIEV